MPASGPVWNGRKSLADREVLFGAPPRSANLSVEESGRDCQSAPRAACDRPRPRSNNDPTLRPVQAPTTGAVHRDLGSLETARKR